MPVMLLPIDGLPEVSPGDDVASVVIAGLERSRLGVKADDVVVVCQKIVSKAEGRVVRLTEVEPSPRARAFAERFDKDAAVVELALREASEVLRMENGHLITRTGAGWIAANSGVDRSNQARAGQATLLPLDPDASAFALRQRLVERFGVPVAVIITDTFGRPWRLGQIDFALGSAGLAVLDDHDGRHDRNGRLLEHTAIATADQLAAAAGLVMAKAAGVPVVIVRGASYRADPSSAARELVRPASDDLFK